MAKKQNENKTFVGAATVRLTRLEKREKALVEIIAQREKTIAKMQKTLQVFKDALAKVRKQQQSDLDEIKELTAIFSPKT